MTVPSSLSSAAQSSSALPPDSIFWGKNGEGDVLTQAQKDAWASAFKSQLQEFDYEITDIEGQVPTGLKGSTLFRNGPSRFERGNNRVGHYLDGDGYLSKIAFSPTGRVYFSSRFVETAELRTEAAADTFCFRTTFGNPTANPLNHLFDLCLKNPANTHVVLWGNKLLALYEAGAPYRIDPETLATLGAETLNGELTNHPVPPSRLAALKRRSRGQQAMTAHPHIDPVTNRLVTWTWGVEVSAKGVQGLNIELVEYDAQWQPLSRMRHLLTGAAVNPHDFALTPNYYIFFENALRFSPLPYLLGLKSPAECLKLLPKPTKVHLIPRPLGDRSLDSPITINTQQWFSIHQACAWENPDGSVEIYSSGWPPSKGGFLTSWRGTAPDFDAIAPTYLWHTRISPDSHTLTHRLASGMASACIAHPHTSPTTETQPSQYLYMAYCNQIGESSPPTGYLKYNTRTHQHQVWQSHPQNFAEEPLFVPNPAAADSAEDDGWLLALMYDYLKDRSALTIFDAKAIDRGPLCRLWFDHPLSHGLHGSWSDRYYGPYA